MYTSFNRLKWIFVGIFAVVNLAILVWTVGWIWPQQHCAETHKWWDPDDRVCAQPVLISDITGRMITDPKARAQALKDIGRAPPLAGALPAPAAPPAPKP